MYKVIKLILAFKKCSQNKELLKKLVIFNQVQIIISFSFMYKGNKSDRTVYWPNIIMFNAQ